MRKMKKSKNEFFGQILAMFLRSQSYDFDAFAHTGAPSGA